MIHFKVKTKTWLEQNHALKKLNHYWVPVSWLFANQESGALVVQGRQQLNHIGFWVHGYLQVRNLGHWRYRQDTIAGALFKKHSRHFEGTYFAQDVGEAEKTGRLAHLRQELLSTLLNDGNAKIIPNIRLNFQSKRLTRKKVLIVFGDVMHLKLLGKELPQLVAN